MFVVFLAALAASLATASAHDARTTRIEARPYYGAVVTIEHGVRVYRPVPPTTHLIIAPGAVSVAVTDGAATVAPSPAAPKDR